MARPDDYFVFPDVRGSAAQERVVFIERFLTVLGVRFQVFDENLVGYNSVRQQSIHVVTWIERNFAAFRANAFNKSDTESHASSTAFASPLLRLDGGRGSAIR